MAARSHLDQVRLVERPGEIVGCEECLRIVYADQLIFQLAAA